MWVAVIEVEDSSFRFIIIYSFLTQQSLMLLWPLVSFNNEARVNELRHLLLRFILYTMIILRCMIHFNCVLINVHLVEGEPKTEQICTSTKRFDKKASLWSLLLFQILWKGVITYSYIKYLAHLVNNFYWIWSKNKRIISLLLQ